MTLDNGNSTINSLTLGGATNGFTSELMDSGPPPRTLNITTSLTLGQNGVLMLSHGGSSITAGTLTLAGSGLTATRGPMDRRLPVNGECEQHRATVHRRGVGAGGNTLNITGSLTNTAGADPRARRWQGER